MSEKANEGIREGLGRLDKLLEHRARLGICVLLARNDSLSFSRLKDLLQETDGSLGAHLRKLEDTGYLNVNKQFQDAERTTFVAVCIPEFLSVYETERLAVELAKFDIDIHNIVINQVVFPDQKVPCRKCQARRKMQDKYLQTVKDIYDDFHLVVNPQLEEEVRGIEKLKVFGKLLFEGYKEA